MINAQKPNSQYLFISCLLFLILCFSELKLHFLSEAHKKMQEKDKRRKEFNCAKPQEATGNTYLCLT
ncbi:conserved domain protein [Bacteroides fluxus YIT 12057]|uniref:Conserved domain protein n=1 Tax=Bacteroides fluxus YIT 12057 TaxID=763034 RepID=F3PT24_9BACE|nr:conserved domain protein [Bacteroides fluxus YIT 12057]